MRHLAVFARWPSEGRVKTRLSPALPPALAARLHRAMLEDALELARAAPVDRRWIYWADAPEADATLEPAGFAARAQEGADLGERLERAFADLLASPGDRAVAIGVDCPALDASRIAAAFERLERHDVVLGPARDGGYYLIGLSRFAVAPFRDVAWGTSEVLRRSVAQAEGAGMTVAKLDPLDDVDVPADLVRWIANAVIEPGSSRAGDALRELGLLPPAP
jgi:rSAM/selenodomain-associated transferase 1